MSGDSDSSFSGSDYYDVDISVYYNETEDFSDEIQVEEQQKFVAATSDIQGACSSMIEDFKRTESNANEEHEDLSNVTYSFENEELITDLTDDLLDSNNDGNANLYRKSDLLMDNECNTYEMTDDTALHTTIADEKTKLKEETDLKKFTPKTLSKLRRLLVDKTHSSGDQEFYIGDLLHAIESELLKLPKEKKKVVKKSQDNIAIKPKKPKQKKLKVLSRYAIRSMALKRNYHMQNMEILASSISKEFIQLDGMIEYFRQVNADFEAEFNQPNTPLGEANLACQRMDDVFTKFKDRIPELQDCYKEVKHCLSLYVKSDKTLRDDLLKNINKYFANSRVEDVLSVQYEDILEAFRKSNRFHCKF